MERPPRDLADRREEDRHFYSTLLLASAGAFTVFGYPFVTTLGPLFFLVAMPCAVVGWLLWRTPVRLWVMAGELVFSAGPWVYFIRNIIVNR